MHVAACLKWVDTRPEVDPLSGRVHDDARWFSASPADRGALEWALRLAAELGATVSAVTAGPPEAEAALRDALAVGAGRAVRVDVDPLLDASSVAPAVAEALGPVDVVCCGDWSLDRGTGSFPAFLAHALGAAQALGCTTAAVRDGEVVAERRLDRGRRERLVCPRPAVMSFEGGSAELRRAPMRAVLAARDAPIRVHRPATPAAPRWRVVATGPFRPRSRELAAPDGDVRQRLLALTGALVERTPPRTVETDAAAAADVVLEQLATWGVEPVAGDEPGR